MNWFKRNAVDLWFSIVMCGVAIAYLFMLTGCASMGDIWNVISGNASQKITRTPIWVYMPDLMIAVDGKVFMGMGVSVLKPESPLQIWSLVDVDRVEISTCSRHDVCQYKAGRLACDIRSRDNPTGRFEVDHDWFGNPDKSLIYHFSPDTREREGSCANLTIEVYDKNALAAWGYLDLRSDPKNNFPAKFSCNATDWSFSGVSVCSTKNGTLQEINLSEDAETYRSNPNCNMKKKSDKQFEFQPGIGWCRASFMNSKKQFHDVIINAYDEVLVRDGK